MNRKRIIIIAIILAAILIVVVALAFIGREKQPTRPSEEAIKVITGKTVELDKKAVDIKSEIIKSPIREDRGDKYLVQSREFTIVYVPGPDQFYVEINNLPVEENQKLAEKWFLDKGFSQQDLCGLGIHISLNYPGVTQEETDAFSGVPQGCPSPKTSS